MPLSMNLEKANYELIPERMKEVIRLYVDRGIQPGGFITAFLSNDLMLACALADDYNKHNLWELACLVHNEVPKAAWGSEEAVREWIDRGGWKGIGILGKTP